MLQRLYPFCRCFAATGDIATCLYLKSVNEKAYQLRESSPHQVSVATRYYFALTLNVNRLITYTIIIQFVPGWRFLKNSSNRLKLFI